MQVEGLARGLNREKRRKMTIGEFLDHGEERDG
jgi:hypothetical protein